LKIPIAFGAVFLAVCYLPGAAAQGLSPQPDAPIVSPGPDDSTTRPDDSATRPDDPVITQTLKNMSPEPADPATQTLKSLSPELDDLSTQATSGKKP
jgi:hypothetical protein